VRVAEVDELRAACAEAARLGGAVLRARWGQARTIELKGGIDLVTDADRASEAAVLGFLAARFPGAAVLAEESGASGAGAGGLRFYVDPLDGTTNYAHGVPHFAVNVAVADAGGLAAGATLDPLRGELFEAARGRGAALNGEPLRHSARTELRGALLVTGFPYDIHQRYEEPLRLFGAFVRRARAVRRFGSAALDLAYVAAGRFDGFWELRLKPWDIAAGIVIVREAGALVTDLDGGDRMLEGGDVVAAPPALLAPMLAVISEERRRPA
jgi:myo-inositol-1(or 4)-monophosphatase